MIRRPFRAASDIDLLRNFNAEAIRKTGGCGYLHPGDITHHFYSGNKTFDHSAISSIWEDRQGVAAWVLCGPRHRSFDLEVRPDLRGGSFEREVIEYAEQRTREVMALYGFDGDQLEAGACRCDTHRSRLLRELGWSLDTDGEYVLNRRSLDAIPEAELPEGYRVRKVRGLDEAGDVAALHVAIFTRSGWTEDLYRRYMQSPGYSAEHEYVVEASDGSLAAFTVTWHDSVNRTGLFEPVGTHPDHRRKGLGRALLYMVMRDMAGAGLTYALVQNEGSNEASRMLYQGCGFRPWQIDDGYVKSRG